MTSAANNRLDPVVEAGHGAGRKETVAIIGMGKTGQAVARFLIHRGVSCEAFDEYPVGLPEALHLPLHIAPFDGALLATYARVIVSPASTGITRRSALCANPECLFAAIWSCSESFTAAILSALRAPMAKQQQCR